MPVTAIVPSLLERGLSRRDVERRLARFGRNALPDPTQVLRWQQWLEQLKSPLIYILLFALTLDLSPWLWQGPERWPVESSSIGLILLPNAGLGIYQEGTAEQALARLKALAVPSVWVIRDGVLVEVSARNLVPGDIARIEAGDRVPADGTLAFGQCVAPTTRSSRVNRSSSTRTVGRSSSAAHSSSGERDTSRWGAPALPALRALLGLVPLGAVTLVAVMLAALLTWVLAELTCRCTIEA
jgi:magnesium-transporting ATPase (P-type)